MRIALVTPPGYIVEECCIGKNETVTLPSQAILATAYLRGKGWDATFLDAQTGSAEFKGFDVVVLWVSLIDGFYHNLKLLQKVKNEGARTVMVMNDPYKGLSLEAMERNPFIDAAIELHERELSLQRLLAYWDRGEMIPGASGVIYRKGGKIIDTGLMPFGKDLLHLTSAASIISGLDLKRYNYAFITAGRGCPFQCTFCSYRQTGTRKRSIDDVVSELQAVEGKIAGITLLDLDMLADRGWTERLCDEIIRRGVKVQWTTDARVGQCAPDVLRKLKQAECRSLVLGLETYSDRGLAKMKKGSTISEINVAIENCKGAGITPYFTIMVGLPWDSEESLIGIARFLDSFHSAFGLTFVRPIVGTPLYEEYKRAGLLKRDLGLDDYIGCCDAPIADTLHLDRASLVHWMKRLRRKELTFQRIKIALGKGGLRPRHIKTALKMLIGRR